MQKLKTRDIADETLELYRDEIEQLSSEVGCHKAFSKYRTLVRKTVIKNHGKIVEKSLSAIFVGYACHYIFAEMIQKYRR